MLTLTLLYNWAPSVFNERIELSILRSLLPASHSANFLFYSTIVCGSLIAFIAIINIIYDCFRDKSNATSDRTNAKAKCDRPLHNEYYDIGEINLTFNSTAAALNGSKFRRNANQSSNKSRKPYSSIALCSFIFALLFLFTFQLSIGFLSVVATIDNNGGNYNHNKEDHIGDIEFVRLLRENLNSNATNYDLLMARRKEFDIIQASFRCCGLESFEDYGDKQVPDTCCKTISFNCSVRKHPSNINYDGCAASALEAINCYIIIMGSVAF
ncbi:hypothetical protein B4U79_19082, partial [Dinothrombium tinctorium]